MISSIIYDPELFTWKMLFKIYEKNILFFVQNFIFIYNIEIKCYFYILLYVIMLRHIAFKSNFNLCAICSSVHLGLDSIRIARKKEIIIFYQRTLAQYSNSK